MRFAPLFLLVAACSGPVDTGIDADLPPFICMTRSDCPMQPGGAEDSACTDQFPGGLCLLDSRATCETTTCPEGSECVEYLGDFYCMRTCALGCKVGQMCGADGVCVAADCAADESVCGPYPCMRAGPISLCGRLPCPSVGECPAPFQCNRSAGFCEEPPYFPED